MALWLNKPFSSHKKIFLNGHYHCGVWEGLDVCSLTLITGTGFLHGILKKMILFIHFAFIFGLYNAEVLFIFSKYWSWNGFSYFSNTISDSVNKIFGIPLIWLFIFITVLCKIYNKLENSTTLKNSHFMKPFQIWHAKELGTGRHCPCFDSLCAFSSLILACFYPCNSLFSSLKKYCFH